MTASDWGPDSPADDPVPADTVAQGAKNPADPDPSASQSGNDGSGDLSASLVDALMRAFKSGGANSMYRCPDPRDESAMVVFPDTDGYSSMRALKFGEIADVIESAGFRLVSEDEATVDRVAAALANADGRRWTNDDGSLTPPISAGLMWPVASGEYYRVRARAAVRALREAGQ